MKKIYFNTLLLFSFVLLLAACKKMDSTFKQFIAPGGITYAGKPTSPLVYPGRNRIKLAWLRGADASVSKAKIFWNNKQDSLSLTIPATGDTISVIIGNLEEKRYNFVVFTFDEQGNSSVPVELLGESFGNRYESLLLARPVLSSEVDATGNLNIKWSAANISGGAYATDVQYTNTDDALVVKRFLVTEATSVISDYKRGTNYNSRTVYMPSIRSIDVFYTPYEIEYASYKIDKTNWLATADSYALTSKLPNGPPAKAIDDNLATFWQTETTSSKVYPHWLAIDFNKQFNLTRLELSCVQDNAATSTFTTFTVQTSANGTTWTNVTNFSLVLKNGTQSFALPSTLRTQYLRIYATSGASYFASLAEVSVVGYE
ncbi:MAG: hypothetical protein EOP54_21840 [Sphingobacteriales bacterium]|nr:MAG: hypothetical protein EOP54_21840 [Sphingobacteriales bacterium]